MSDVAAVYVKERAFFKVAETELLQRCQNGDQAAFELLIKRYERRVFGLVYQILRNPGEVEDIAQEVFTKLFFSLPRFRLEASFDAWLYRIVVNQCYDHLRKQKREPQTVWLEPAFEDAMFLEGSGLPKVSTDSGIHKTMEAKQLAESLLRWLPPKDRLLLILKEVEELSIEELMAVFKTSKSAIKLRLFRARKQLRTAYEKSQKQQRK
jgi:RNA polymerase sigma-70 factor, ECF subfamily